MHQHILCVLGQPPNRPSVVVDDDEDKVSEDALKELGLLQNCFPTYLSYFLLVYSLCHICNMPVH